MSSEEHIPSTPNLVLPILAMGGAWILFVAGTRRHEMIVGAGALLLSSFFLYSVRRQSTLRLRFHVADLAACWRIPWYVVTGCYEITLLLFRDLFAAKPPESLYRVSAFITAEDDPLLTGRRVLATAYTTVAPNFIIIGIDFKQGKMLFHQLSRSSIPKMSESLGARP